jgi:flagellum-specific peptidoglycan hydrolase FlgJ
VTISARSAGSAGSPMMQGWINPVLKVAAALVLFFYLTQRDIQFSIQMKAPLGVPGTPAAAAQATADQMSLVQPVRLLSGSAAAPAPAGQPENLRLNAVQVEQYLERFAHVARAEMEKFGIPASVKMAQAILESQAGQAMDAQIDNNHFGAPMGEQTFESAWRNWREHSLLVQHRLQGRTAPGKDYRAWARILQEIGYSEDPNYANELLSIIDRFHLEQLDDSTI